MLLILGAGEYGKLVKELALSSYEKIDFLDDNSEEAIGKIDDCAKFKDEYDYAIVAIGDNELRIKLLERLETAGFNIPTIISDKAYVSKTAKIASGVVIEPFVTIHTNVTIEKGAIISAGAVINHDAIVKKGSHIDCNAIVGAAAAVPEKSHLDYGQIIIRNNHNN